MLATVLAAVAAGCCLLLLAVVAKAIRFCFRRAYLQLQYVKSSIPGPPASSHILGELATAIRMDPKKMLL